MALEWVSYFWGAESDELTKEEDSGTSKSVEEEWFWIDILQLNAEEDGFIIVGKTLVNEEDKNRKSYAQVTKQGIPQKMQILTKEKSIQRQIRPNLISRKRKLEKLLAMDLDVPNIKKRANLTHLIHKQTSSSISPPQLAIEWYSKGDPSFGTKKQSTIMKLKPNHVTNLKHTSNMIIDINYPKTVSTMAHNITNEIFNLNLQEKTKQSQSTIETLNYNQLTISYMDMHILLHKLIQIEQKNKAKQIEISKPTNANIKAILPFYYPETSTTDFHQESEPFCIEWHTERHHDTKYRHNFSLLYTPAKTAKQLFTVAIYMASQYICFRNTSRMIEDKKTEKEWRCYNKEMKTIHKIEIIRNIEKERNQIQRLKIQHKNKGEKKIFKHAKLNFGNNQKSKNRYHSSKHSGFGGLRAC